ncbi:MAG: sensor histidine kinase N-terminal domain-containing protein [Rhodocyclales bacterium]|nr:sensor histidine kinase N-terminal domain-containing protein [Rhodocyclales bacterium]
MGKPVPSLRGHLLALLLPVAVVALLISVVAVYLIALNATAESLDQGLADAAEICVEELRSHPDRPFAELPGRAQRVLFATAEDRVFFALRDGVGHVLSGERLFAEDLPWGTLTEPAFFDLNNSGYWLRGLSVVFEVGGVPRQLTLATTALKREQLMGDILLGMVAPQLALFLLTIVLVWAGVRHALEPLTELRDEIGRRSERDLQALDPQRTPNELRPVVAEINQLFVRLDGAIGAQRHFIADAAHQLRTPIAGLLAQIEADGTATSNPALAQTARRLARLVAQLLALSRAEPGVMGAQEEFDLAALIRDAANDWLPQAFRRGVDIRFELARARVVGSPHAWREMLANLVDNAIRYGRPQGVIVVRCLIEGDDAVVQVDDDGPGIPAAEREKVFERFYRPAGSTADGCGLGLPIVRALAARQGAKVSLGDTPGGSGLHVELRVPRTAIRESDA